MINVRFYDNAEDSLLKFAVIISRTEGRKWVLCKHRERNTFEVPGGHREPGEDIRLTAERELYEETGALDFKLSPVCIYSVSDDGSPKQGETFGALYFAEIKSFEPELHSEIEKIFFFDNIAVLPGEWTYPLIQPKLIAEAKRRGII